MNIELAKRAVACKHWKWMPGMLWSIGPEPGWVRASTGRIQSSQEDGGPVSAPKSCVPDLDDPATLGCLLALVRLAQGDCTIWTMVDVDCDEGTWLCTGLEVGEIGSGYSEAHALVAALEAAP